MGLFERWRDKVEGMRTTQQETRFILIISQDGNQRRLVDDNLILRGYLAVGIASVDEGKRLLRQTTPELIMICGRSIDVQDDLKKLRSHYGEAPVPIVLVSPDVVDPEWLAHWNIVAQLRDSMDLRRLVDTLQPWLASITRLEHPADGNTVNRRPGHRHRNIEPR